MQRFRKQPGPVVDDLSSLPRSHDENNMHGNVTGRDQLLWEFLRDYVRKNRTFNILIRNKRKWLSFFVVTIIAVTQLICSEGILSGDGVNSIIHREEHRISSRSSVREHIVMSDSSMTSGKDTHRAPRDNLKRVEHVILQESPQQGKPAQFEKKTTNQKQYSGSQVPKNNISFSEQSPSALITPRVIWLVPEDHKKQSGKKYHAKSVRNEEPKKHLGEYYAGVDTTPCVPMQEWQTMVGTTCNAFHEIDMVDGLTTISAHVKESNQGIKNIEFEERSTKLSLLGIGGWRAAFKLVHNPHPGSFNTEDIILKTLRWKKQDFDPLTYHRHTVDAQITEHLSSSSRIIDIYGFCGESVLNEVASGGTLTSIIERDRKSGTLIPRKKVEYARDLAMALSAAHGGNNVTLVHRDMKADNIVINHDGILKLNDFNDGELLHWNKSSSTQCHFRKMLWNPTWKSNEEVRELPLTEKVDVYALGGLLYFILTEGDKPYKGLSWKEIMKLVTNGIPPTIPDEYIKSKDPLIAGILRVMKKCHEYFPNDRPSANAVAHELDILLDSKATQVVDKMGMS
mmetsp:Transcript_46634/g.68924  ORF Transcript_46634/g.68924 Transcript_46634/m.68924 type:complete len:568 (-) Transcript_46634:51-1754(-)